MTKAPAVYLLANKSYGTLYIGVTSNLPARVWQHQNNQTEGFTKRHQIHRLVWFEQHETMIAAITREKQMKSWYRAWKVNLVQADNPAWLDLSGELTS